VLSWFLVNIIVPFVVPVGGMALVMLLPLEDAVQEKLRLIGTVKDGQLCWGVVAVCAATLYELWPSESGNFIRAPWGGILAAGLIAMTASAAILAASGAVFTTGFRTKTSGIGWVRHYKVFTASLVLAALAGAAALMVHSATESEKSARPVTGEKHDPTSKGILQR
jgi:hypothetical protein